MDTDQTPDDFSKVPLKLRNTNLALVNTKQTKEDIESKKSQDFSMKE